VAPVRRLNPSQCNVAAAEVTALAVERGAPGVYNIVDEEPTPVREWLPEFARILGAKPMPYSLTDDPAISASLMLVERLVPTRPCLAFPGASDDELPANLYPSPPPGIYAVPTARGME
jgi:hypothetical protein